MGILPHSPSAPNPFAVDHETETCAHRLFEIQAARAPGAPAVELDGRGLTYGELDRRANQLARRLRAMGVGPEVRVGICAERSLEMIVAVLGVLKAGGAYVPVDPAYPADRLAFMLADARAEILVTQGHAGSALPPHSMPTVTLDPAFSAIAAESADAVDSGVGPRNACYVIYTSGSTGRPKGVVVEHRSFCNLVEGQRRALGLDAESRVLQFHRFGFDVATSEFFLTLASGGLLCLARSEQVLPGPELLAQLVDRRITMSQIPPSALSLLDESRVPALRTLITGGETFPAALAARWATGRRFFNVYGPTETTCAATMSEHPGGEVTPTIGHPLPGTLTYVLDERMQLVGPGVPGELHIGGLGVARGYHGRPALTADRYVPDPFSTEPGARMYRSGDLVRWTAAGELEFLGRVDEQVKIRGFRIELGEIEAVLSTHPSVRANAVAAREDRPGDRRLVAYVVAAGDAPAAADLRAHAASKLPDYMVPSAFVLLPALPVTPHGKIDKKALPAPDASLFEEREITPPRTDTERALVEIWRDLLGVASVGVTDDFFMIGGHSLLAVRLANRMRERFGWSPQMASLFERPTIEALAAQVDASAERPAPSAEIRLDRRAEGEQPYTGLSGTERRLWFLEHLSPGARAYQVPQAFTLRGAFSEDALRRSLGALARRHELLRTTYPEIDGVPVRRVDPEANIPLRFEDLSTLPASERDAAARSLVEAEVRSTFDLERGPLTRALLLRLAADDHRVILHQHHILTDEWSAGLILRELSALYDAASRGGEAALPELHFQYSDYARAEQEALSSGAFAASRAYWKARLAGVPRLDLPILRPAVQSGPGPEGHLSFELSESEGRGLVALSRSTGCTRFMVWYAALSAVLARYSGQTDFGLGVVMANREASGAADLVGFFTNTVVMRTDLSGDPTFREIVARARETALGAYRHQGLPFDVAVQDQGVVSRRPGETPFYDVGFFEATTPPSGDLHDARLLSDTLPDGTTSAKEALTVSVGHGADGRGVHLAFDGARVDRASVSLFAGHLETLLRDAVDNPDRRLSELSLVPETERAQIESWNRTEGEYPKDLCIHHLFEAQARRTPDAPAVEYEGEVLSYRELDRRANQLAHHLRTLGVGPEVRVGLSVERSLEMTIGLMGTLKAGGAYVPMDPTYPKDRLAFMLSDARASVLLTQSHLLPNMPPHEGVVVCLDVDGEKWAQEPETPPETGVGPGNAMYLLYTSGSTGRPKGAINTHRGLVNHQTWFVKDLKFTPKDRMLQRTAMSFDGSVWEFWSPWCTGGCLVVAPRDANKNPQMLGDVIRTRSVTVLHVVPTLLEAMVDTGAFEGQTSLRLVGAGGEALKEHVRKSVAEAARCEVYNLYGPTEAAIDTMTWHGSESRGAVVPIGPPRMNIRAYVLDASLRQVPVGLPGEMYLSSVQLARGYHARPGLTAERFVPDPFSKEPGARMYRTGDLVRWTPEGEIEFLGRLDHQVKIRGFRIELGEIEAALLAHPGVRACVVVAREDTPGNKRLVAYVVPVDGESAPAVWREHLKSRLPEFMVPAFMMLAELPVLPNGKVDRNRLPVPELTRESAGHYVAPRTPTERALVEIWEGLLGVTPVGVTEDFFALGGHSLLALRLMSAVKKRLGWSPSMTSLFERPTIEALAAQVDGTAERPEPGATLRLAARGEGEAPFEGLSGTERRLWFLEKLSPEAKAYQVPQVFSIRGAFSEAALRQALDSLARRHEILRTAYPEVGGAPVRRVSAEGNIPLRVEDLSALPASEREAAARALVAAEVGTAFDLATGPLTRVLVLRMAEDEHVVVLHQHHILTDEWSAGVLLRELDALYQAAAAGGTVHLPELAHQYSEYARAEQEGLDGDGLAASRAYWKAQLAGVPRLDLGLLRPTSPAGAGPEGQFVLRIPEADVRQVLSLARSSGCTQFMVGYAAVLAVLLRHSRQTDFGLGAVVANRETPGTEGLLGFFTNTVVLRTDLSGDPTFRELLGRARATALGAYRHQALPFDVVVQDQGAPRRPGETPFYDVSFFEVTALASGAFQESRLTSGVMPEGVTSAKEALAISLVNTGEGLEIHASYDTRRADRASVERLAGHLRALFVDAVANPDRRLSELAMIGDEERAQMLAWSESPSEPAPYQCIHHMFEAVAARVPDATAVESEIDRRELTYAELDGRANQLAHHLRKRGVGPEVRVAICAERSIDMIVCVLGVLKAGGVYVPMDSTYPRERLAFTLADSRAAILLTQESLRDLLPPHDRPVLLVDTQWAEMEGEPKAAPDSGVTPDNACYIIYTSGSTGKPKGVVVQHRGLCNLVDTQRATLGAGPGTRVVQFHRFGFDVATGEIFTALGAGGTLCLFPNESLLPGPELIARLRDHHVHLGHIPPTALAVMPEDELPEFHTLIVGGEACPAGIVNRWRKGRRIFNAYGPTETTVITTMLACPGGDTPPTIGRPLANMRVHVLDADLRPVPIGAPGELCIGGVGVARGYLDRPGLTADRFVPDPFSKEPGARMYRSGDLVRWTEAGEIAFLGRVDEQVKIRGFRIEIGEIEAALSAHPSVRACAVTVREDTPGDRRLVAYVVPAEGEISPRTLREHLSARLPEYMVPPAFVALGVLPVTAHRKVDKKALPAPDASSAEAREVVPPRTATERALVAIWQELLRIEPVGVTDDFFVLGGHSLLAVRMMSLVKARLGWTPPMASLFETPTIEALAALVDGVADRPALAADLRPRPRAEGEPAFEGLSSTERRIWFVQHLSPEARAYQVPQTLLFRGEFSRAALQKSLDVLAARHEILRTVYPEIDGVPVRRVAPDMTLPLRWEDVSSVAVGERDAAARALLAEEVKVAFDLERGPLMRALVIRVAEDAHVVCLHQHHIQADEWSAGVMMDELSELFEASLRGLEASLPPLHYKYSDFARAEQEALDGGALASSRAYWKAQLAGLPRLDLPALRPSPQAGPGPEANVSFRISKEEHEAFLALSRAAGCTPFMAWYAVVSAVLGRHSGQADFGLGVVMANREVSGTEGLLGFFTNTAVLRADLSGDPTFRELLGRARVTAREAYRHQALPFDVVVSDQGVERKVGDSPLYQVSYYEILMPDSAFTARWSPFPEALPEGVMFAKEALSIIAVRGRDETEIVLNYDQRRADRASIELLSAHLRALFEDALRHPDHRLSELALSTEEERAQIAAWNETAADYPEDRCIHELFEAQVDRTPDAPALEYRGETLSYRELDARANRLAHHLRGLGVGPDELVGVHLERSIDLVVGLLAVLKAGGAYVPMDPKYPRERLAFMLEDAQAKVVVTRSAIAASLGDHGARALLVDELRGALAEEPDSRVASGARSDHLAYLIYTSGSTGRPKAVAIEHRQAVNFLTWAGRQFGPDELSGVLAATSVCFDLSIFELFTPLSTGGRILLAENVLALRELPAAEEVTLINTVPSALTELLRSGPLPAKVRTVNVAGEPLPSVLVQRCYREPSVRSVYNLYGPSETTTYSTFTRVPEDLDRAPTIGRPLANTTIHLLDARMQPVPIGVVGELYIGGAGVARGYLRRPEQTAERFLRDPSSEEPGARIYRTGDLARYLPDGDIEFLGRIDHQVKVRGFRIELGEIEAALLAHPSVRACVVVAREDSPGDKRLVGYVVPGDAQCAVSALEEHLRARLPAFMVPAFVLLAELPLLPNGKVNRAALPAPEVALDGGDRVAPRTPTERALVEIWEALLGVKPIGVTDEFFALGGHSLLALRLMSAVKKRLGWSPPMTTLFDRPTIEALAAQVDGTAERTPPGAILRPVGRREGEAAFEGLSGTERRLWLLERLSPEARSYQVPLVLPVKGRFSEAALRQSLDTLARRHEILRTAYPEVDGAPVRRVSAEVAIPLRVEDFSALSVSERDAAAGALLAREVGAAFDLERGPLTRVLAIRMGEDESVIVLHQHHIQTDEWSAGLLARELTSLYTAALEGRTAALPELPYQYADHARAEQEALEGDGFTGSRAYWKARLAGVPRLVLPILGAAPATGPGPEGRLAWTLPENTARDLVALARSSGSTRFMVWYAAVLAVLSRYSEQADFGLGALMANREVPGTEALLGFFTNTVVLRTELSGDPTFRELLALARETTLGAFRHQALPFDVVVQDQGLSRRAGETPFYDVTVFEATAPDAVPRGPGLSSGAPEGVTSAKDALSLALARSDSGVEIQISFDGSRVARAAVERLAGHLDTLLREALSRPDTRLSDLPLMKEAERAQIAAWATTVPAVPVSGRLHDIVLEQAEKNPGAAAVVFEGQRLSYRDLASRALRLARRLRAAGVGPEVRVALHAPQTPATIVGILAVLEAGGAYVPMEPDWPAERAAQIVRDARARVVLGPAGLADRLGLSGSAIRHVDVDRDDPSEAAPPRVPGGAGPDNLAYIIYTSGSTGRPKGVAITHATIVRSTLSRLIHYRKPIRSFLLTPSFAFDGSLAGLFWMLTQGGAVVLPGPGAQKDPAQLLALLAEENVSHMQSVPSFYDLVLDRLAPGQSSPLEVMIATGEAISPALVRHHHEKLPGVSLFNEYGPTEATVWSTVHLLAPDESRASVPIGKPVAGLRAYVLDARLRLAPIGLAGELYIGGDQLARGYLDRPGLSAERFVPDPFSPEPGARMYRTGDLARWTADGELQFLGRLDHQVKIRGFRVELEEIEALLLAHPRVKACVVVAREDEPGKKRLVAYLVAAEGQAEAHDLRNHLRARLPDFMVPSAFAWMGALPMTHNGKIDRKALPAPQESRAAEPGYTPARTAVEAWLVEQWESLLGARPVGVHDDFFALGGHSLLAVRLAAAIERRFGLALPLTHVFSFPTIAELARELGPSGDVLGSGISPAAADSPLVPLRRTGTSAPLFCVHAIGGTASSYRDLARELGRPVFGIQARSPARGDEDHETIEAMAERYVAAIRRARPEGPVHLCGWSFGGVVAFEMARQLARSGAPVGSLVLVDSVVPRGSRDPEGASNEAGYVGLIARIAAAHGLGVDVSAIDALPAPEARARIETLMEAGGWLPAGEAGDLIERMIGAMRVHDRALSRYVPGPYAGPVTVLRASDRDPRDGDAPDMDWSALCEGPLDVRTVPGDHQTVLLPPNAGGLARILTAILEPGPGGADRGERPQGDRQ